MNSIMGERNCVLSNLPDNKRRSGPGGCTCQEFLILGGFLLSAETAEHDNYPAVYFIWTHWVNEEDIYRSKFLDDNDMLLADDYKKRVREVKNLIVENSRKNHDLPVVQDEPASPPPQHDDDEEEEEEGEEDDDEDASPPRATRSPTKKTPKRRLRAKNSKWAQRVIGSPVRPFVVDCSNAAAPAAPASESIKDEPGHKDSQSCRVKAARLALTPDLEIPQSKRQPLQGVLRSRGRARGSGLEAMKENCTAEGKHYVLREYSNAGDLTRQGIMEVTPMRETPSTRKKRLQSSS
ncbi:MAG: hypothetical protein SGPRY_014836 [Prymnesium sp.]